MSNRNVRQPCGRRHNPGLECQRCISAARDEKAATLRRCATELRAKAATCIETAEALELYAAEYDSPGHGGAGQTAGSKGSETSHAGEDSTHVESVTHTGAPGDRGTAIDPYERILLPNGGVRFRRRRPPAPEPSDDVPPSTWLPPDAATPDPLEGLDEDERLMDAMLRRIGEEERTRPMSADDVAMLERVKANVLGGGGT